MGRKLGPRGPTAMIRQRAKASYLSEQREWQEALAGLGLTEADARRLELAALRRGEPQPDWLALARERGSR